MTQMGTIFSELLKLVPRFHFDQTVNQYGLDRYAKSFTSWRQFITLLYAQVKGKGVLCDEVISMAGFYAEEDYPEDLRRIEFYDEETEKVLVFLTNHFTLAATTMAAIYKARWQIELFFKWIRQNLKIKSFLGTSKNAVMSQIRVAMCHYLRLAYIKYQTKYIKFHAGIKPGDPRNTVGSEGTNRHPDGQTGTNEKSRYGAHSGFVILTGQ